jgi:hypothetical protein
MLDRAELGELLADATATTVVLFDSMLVQYLLSIADETDVHISGN